MRIGVDLKNNYKYGVGIAQQFSNTLRGLLRVDDHNEYVLLSPNGFRVPGLHSSHMTSVDVPFPNRFGRLGYVFYDQVIFQRYARALRLDVLLSPYFDLPVYGRLPDVVATVHDLVLVERADLYPRLFGAYYRSCLRATLKRAKHILTVSEFSKQRIVELMHVDPARVTVIPNRIDERFRRLEDRCVIGSRLEIMGVTQPYVLYTGGVDSRKNLPTLFRAFASVRARIGNALTLVCTGDANRYQVAFEEAGMPRDPAAAVCFVGRLSIDDLVLLYNGASAVAYPSLYEGFGYPVAEAMACGVPVVCSRVTSMPEVGGDVPFYCDPLDADDVAEQLYQALTDLDTASSRIAAGIARTRRYSAGGHEVDEAIRARELLAVLESRQRAPV